MIFILCSSVAYNLSCTHPFYNLKIRCSDVKIPVWLFMYVGQSHWTANLSVSASFFFSSLPAFSLPCVTTQANIHPLHIPKTQDFSNCSLRRLHACRGGRAQHGQRCTRNPKSFLAAEWLKEPKARSVFGNHSPTKKSLRPIERNSYSIPSPPPLSLFLRPLDSPPHMTKPLSEWGREGFGKKAADSHVNNAVRFYSKLLSPYDVARASCFRLVFVLKAPQKILGKFSWKNSRSL